MPAVVHQQALLSSALDFHTPHNVIPSVMLKTADDSKPHEEDKVTGVPPMVVVPPLTSMVHSASVESDIEGRCIRRNKAPRLE